MPDNDEARLLLAVLAERRELLLRTTRDLTDEQARLTPTVSQLSIGGLVKHLAATERSWLQFVVQGSAGIDWEGVDWENIDAAAVDTVPEWLRQDADEFRLLPEESLAGVVELYRTVATETERVVLALEDLDIRQRLPPAPWVPEGATRSARQVLLHMIGETAQHAGHADIIRESLDGRRSSG